MSRDQEDKRAAKFLAGVKATLDDRATSYPPYSQEAQRVSLVWNALHDTKMTPHDVAKFMLVVKLVRYAAGNSPDSLTDLVGYAARIEGMA